MPRKRVSERQQYLNQEYARLRRNLLQRLRRREKAGDKVDWSSVPRKPKRVTPASIRSLEQGNLIQQRTGEYKFKRGYGYMARIVQQPRHEQYDKEFSEMLKRNRQDIEQRVKSKAVIGVQPSTEIAPTTMSYIQAVKDLINELPDGTSFRTGAGTWSSVSLNTYKTFLLSLVDRAVSEEGEERMEWYYAQKQDAIASHIQAMLMASDEETFDVHFHAVEDIIYPSTVTYDIYQELWNVE